MSAGALARRMRPDAGPGDVTYNADRPREPEREDHDDQRDNEFLEVGRERVSRESDVSFVAEERTAIILSS